MYNIKDIEKEYKKLGCPKEFWKPNLEKFINNDFYLCLSLRQDNGKTTNTLLECCLIPYKLYGYTTAYLRNDISMIARSKVSSLFDTIIEYGYIEKLFKDYNSVRYDALKRGFFLVHRNDTGEIDKEQEKPFLEVFACEKWKDYKSGYANPNLNIIIWDEFTDTTRVAPNLITELFNIISTLTRCRADAHVIGLSNNTTPYSQLWDDFDIKEDMDIIGYGSSFTKKTDLGTTLYCEMLALTSNRVKSIEDKKVRFFGFNTPKTAQFIGTATWQGYNYPHLELDIEERELVAFIRHRGIYTAIYVVSDNKHKPIVLFTPFNIPSSDDLPIYTIHPFEYNEFTVEQLPRFIQIALKEKRIAFSNNRVGLLIDDFFKESGRKIKLY